MYSDFNQGLLAEYRYALLEAFEDVFDVKLEVNRSSLCLEAEGDNLS